MKLKKITINKNKPKKEKKKKEKTKKINKKNLILIIFISLGIIAASCVLAFALYIIVSSPDFIEDKLYTKESTIIYDKNNNEIARIGKKNVERAYYEELPQSLIDALIATEDSRFFQHNGFDAARFVKASLGQLAGQNAGGASTLSMQVIKNTYTGLEASGIKGIIRKFTDIYMAVFKLEASHSKEQIIEFYLNSQWLSGGTTVNFESINGVKQGSKYYFGKSVSDLTLTESALLVGMFNGPDYYNPYRNPKNASARRSVVLSLMVRHGYITEEEKKFAESIPVESLLADHSEDTYINKYQAFIDYTIDEVIQKTGDNPRQIPMKIYTTLDPDVQDVLVDLETGKLRKWDNDKVQFGMAVTNVEDGSIAGMSGGRNYRAQGLNRATTRRQPGSTAKPLFDYGPLLEYVAPTTATRFLDEPWTYTNGQVVRNYDSGFIGPTSMRWALVDSRNIPALQAWQITAKEVGTKKIEEFVHSLGIDYGQELYESAAIGGGIYISPLESSAAYAAFARGGYYIEPYSFKTVEYIETEEKINYQPQRVKVMSEETAYLMNNLLVSGGQQQVGGYIHVNGTEVAAKSGTTTLDAADARKLGVPTYTTPEHWVVTYSPDYCIAFLYAYDKLSSTTYLTTPTGYNTRKQIMAAVANKIYKENSRFQKPSSIVTATVEIGTYPLELASEFTPNDLKSTEYFKSGYEPSDVSKRFSKLDKPSNGTSSFDGTTITLTWDEIGMPDAINPTLLAEFFNANYGNYAEKYYNRRIDYNEKNIGSIGYQVYLKNNSEEDSELISLGYTTKNSYSYTPSEAGDYTFVIKSAYSIFKNNMSDGLEITAQAKIDTTVPGTPDEPEPDEPEPDNPSDNENNTQE